MPTLPGAPYDPAAYVARPHEEDLTLDHLERGQPVFLWGARRMGGSWLASRVADRWKAQGVDRRLAWISLAAFPRGAFSSIGACLRAVAAALVASLDEADIEPVSSPWSGRGDVWSGLDDFLSRNVLSRFQGELLFVLDRADLLVRRGLHDAFPDFFRSRAENARNGAPWSRLRLLASISLHPSSLRTEIPPPFFPEVAAAVEVSDLDRAQVADLARRQAVALAARELDRIVEVAGGHPYLVQAVLADLSAQRYTTEALAEGAPIGPSLVADHLDEVGTRLAASPDLAGAFEAIAGGEGAAVPPDRIEVLLRQGLVRREAGSLAVRHGLYRRLLGPSAATSPRRKARVFVSHVAADDASSERLKIHLGILERDGLIEPWHGRRLLQGAAWDRALDRRMAQANVILLLVSADFLASDYCWDVEVKRALERHEAREALVLPVILRPCDWRGSHQLCRLDPLPAEGVPASRWTDPEDAWVDVAAGLRRLIADRGRW